MFAKLGPVNICSLSNAPPNLTTQSKTIEFNFFRVIHAIVGYVPNLASFRIRFIRGNNSSISLCYYLVHKVCVLLKNTGFFLSFFLKKFNYCPA